MHQNNMNNDAHQAAAGYYYYSHPGLISSLVAHHFHLCSGSQIPTPSPLSNGSEILCNRFLTVITGTVACHRYLPTFAF